jgi:hypothetical protein
MPTGCSAAKEFSMNRTFSIAVNAAARTAGRRGWILAGVACLMVLGLEVRPASAQFYFGRAANQPFSGTITVVSKVPGVSVPSPSVNIRGALQEAMSREVAPRLTETLRAELPKRKFAGFTPYLVGTPTIPSSGQLYAGTDGRGFTVRYVVSGASARIGLHTPDVKVGPLSLGAPRSANPEFVVPFGIEMTADVSTGNAQRLAVQSVKIKLNVGKPSGANFTGNLAQVVNDLVAFVGGPDFLAQAQNRINGRQVTVVGPINVELAKLPPAIAAIGKAVFIQPVLVSGTLRLEVSRALAQTLVR